MSSLKDLVIYLRIEEDIKLYEKSIMMCANHLKIMLHLIRKERVLVDKKKVEKEKVQRQEL